MATGDTLSTGGNTAQGDRTVAGAAGLDTSEGFSVGVLSTTPPPNLAWVERGFKTVALGPTEETGFGFATVFASFFSVAGVEEGGAATC